MRAAEEGGRLRQGAPGLGVLTDAPYSVLIAADENPTDIFTLPRTQERNLSLATSAYSDYFVFSRCHLWENYASRTTGF